MVVTTRMFHKMHEPTISDMDRIDFKLRNIKNVKVSAQTR